MVFALAASATASHHFGRIFDRLYFLSIVATENLLDFYLTRDPMTPSVMPLSD